MFQLLQPIWLSALAALGVPVIIHLWNQRPGKILKVGSIALVRKGALSHTKKIFLSDRWLLLLRCLLLGCMALTLSSPVWRHTNNQNVKGWVLMPRHQLTATYNHFKPVADSLLQAGYQFHYFEEGFRQDKLEHALQTTADTIPELSYRSTVDLLNQQGDAHLPMYIFTDNYLRHFTGPRNSVFLNLHWFTYTPDKNSTSSKRDTAALHVAIVTHAYQNDGRYLQAALEAIARFSKKNIVVKTVSSIPDVTTHQDWLFWLNDTPLTDSNAATNIVVYAKGELVKNASYILPAAGESFAAIPLFASIVKPDSAASWAGNRWQDGFGHPLLTVHQRQNGAFYMLYTHIDPAWNELPWSENFPALLYQLLYMERNGFNTDNNAIIGGDQAVPVIQTSGTVPAKSVLYVQTPLDSIGWLLVFILFFAERLFSFHYYKSKNV